MLEHKFFAHFNSLVRAILLGTSVLALAFPVPFAANAQVVKLPRVGVITTMSPERPTFKGLRADFDAAGYVIGRNLSLEIAQRHDFTELESAA